MKKFFIAGLVLALLLVSSFLGASGVSARSAHPSRLTGASAPLSLLDCSTSCLGYDSWDFTSYGTFANVYVPNYTGSPTHGFYRGIEVLNGAAQIDVRVGYCFGTKSTSPRYDWPPVCTSTGEWFYEECNYGTTICTFTNVAAVQTGEKGTWARIGFQDGGTSGNGVGEAVIDETGTNHTNIECNYSLGQSNSCGAFAFTYGSFSHMYIINNEVNVFTTEVDQGDFAYTNNAYMNSFGSFVYETACPGTTNGVNGAQMNIATCPASGNSGGHIDSANEAADDTPYGLDIDSIN